MIKKGRLTIMITKAKLTKPNFEMYKSYCYEIHDKEKETESGFENFLCMQSLEYNKVQSDV